MEKPDATASSSGVPTGSIIMTDHFPDVSLTNAGFGIYRVVFLDSAAQ